MKIKPIDSTNGSKAIIEDIITCILEFWGEKHPKIAVNRAYHGPGNLVFQVDLTHLSTGSTHGAGGRVAYRNIGTTNHF